MPVVTASRSDAVGRQARRLIARRLLPFLFVLYLVAYLDRVNISYAALEMTKALGFTPAVYGFGAGVFFLGYLLLEVPGAILVERWSARRWIARIMISWGIVAVAMAWVETERQFFWLRFLLGAAEAGFFPGMIVYLSHWFCKEDRARAIAMFAAAIPITNIIGAPLSGWLLDIDWLGMAGWRWLFVIEGAPAILLGVVTLIYLTDQPRQAHWLAPEQRSWIEEELQRERRHKESLHASGDWRSLLTPALILLVAAYFFIQIGLYGLNFWLPTLVKALFGASNFRTGLMSALPYAVSLVAMLGVAWSSDRMQERRWHTAGPLLFAALGFLLSGLGEGYGYAVLAACSLAAAGISAYLPVFWNLPTGFLSGWVAAAAIGIINSLGNLGGFAGPYLVGYLTGATGSFVDGMYCMAVASGLAAGLILALRYTARPVQRR